jgi:hypothetical protein
MVRLAKDWPHQNTEPMRGAVSKCLATTLADRKQTRALRRRFSRRAINIDELN